MQKCRHLGTEEIVEVTNKLTPSSIGSGTARKGKGKHASYDSGIECADPENGGRDGEIDQGKRTSNQHWSRYIYNNRSINNKTESASQNLAEQLSKAMGDLSLEDMEIEKLRAQLEKSQDNKIKVDNAYLAEA